MPRSMTPKDIATVKAALECTVEHLEGEHDGKVVVNADVFNALYDFAETALSSPPAAPTPDNNGWRDISTAPRDGRVLVWSGQEIYAAHWSKNPLTDDEAWIVAEWGEEGDQALVKPTHWKPLAALPPPPALDKGE